MSDRLPDTRGAGGYDIEAQPVMLAGLPYQAVAASQTDEAMGTAGIPGDILNAVLIVPATTSPGAVSVKDGSGSAITVFTGGADSVSNLVPFYVPLGFVAAAGGWSVTTGADVSALVTGVFTNA